MNGLDSSPRPMAIVEQFGVGWDDWPPHGEREGSLLELFQLLYELVVAISSQKASIFLAPLGPAFMYCRPRMLAEPWRERLEHVDWSAR